MYLFKYRGLLLIQYMYLFKYRGLLLNTKLVCPVDQNLSLVHTGYFNLDWNLD